MGQEPARRGDVSPLCEAICAALALVDSATIDGPLAVVPTEKLQALKRAIDALMQQTLPVQQDELCSN